MSTLTAPEGGDRTPAIPLLESMRRQIEERLRLQQQLLGVTVAVAAAELSFFANNDENPSIIAALFALLFVGFGLAILRNDQEITVLARHLLRDNVFGSHAIAQAMWEYSKFATMQKRGVLATLTTTSQVIGIYGLPVLAAIASGVSAVSIGLTRAGWVVIGLAGMFAIVFAGAAADVMNRYQKLGQIGQELVHEHERDFEDAVQRELGLEVGTDDRHPEG